MKKTWLTWLIFLLPALLAFENVSAKKILSVTDFGAETNSRKNVVPAIRKALQACEWETEEIVVSFPAGRYDFWPSYCETEQPRTNSKGQPYYLGIELKHLKNITIDGNGSEFIFHGCMRIAQLDSCENISLVNFSVDWDRPYISQAEIIRATDEYLDVSIDKTQYPYIFENGKIMFTGEGWKSPVLRTFNNLYDKDRKEILPQTWDDMLGDVFEQKAEEIGGNVIRFHGKSSRIKPEKIEKGTFVALCHAHYLTNGIEIRQSKDIILKNLTIYHALSMGVSAKLSENITMDNVNITVNEAKGRVFSSVADALNFNTCKGLIKIENCAHTGQGDDFVNISGSYSEIREIVDDRTINVSTRATLTLQGDEMWFLNRNNSRRGETRIVESIVPIYDNNKVTAYRIRFTSALPGQIKAGDFVENKTWTPSLELRNCRILKKHRARGILVSTPQKVIIENNYFRTAGTAILICGELGGRWSESGAVTDVNIRNNVFEDCLTSGNRSGSPWQWGDAVITILPSTRPLDERTEAFHENIFIRNNIFKVFDAPLVRARSVKELQFTGNKIIKTFNYSPYTWQKSAFLLDGCRKVLVKDNTIDPQYTTRSLLIEHMKKSDV
ncbi:MAG: hypothetical protein LBG28_12530, partial [Tannerella sp.]|nr:hypothetical protein [Tannerella sp.]